MLKGFRQFIFRGNVVDLAVAVVIGAEFGGLVTAFVKDLLTPLIAAVVGKPDFSAFKFTVNKSVFLYGDFVNAVVSLVLVAAAVYFFIVLPMNARLARLHRGSAARSDHETVPGVSERHSHRCAPVRALRRISRSCNCGGLNPRGAAISMASVPVPGCGRYFPHGRLRRITIERLAEARTGFSKEASAPRALRQRQPRQPQWDPR